MNTFRKKYGNDSGKEELIEILTAIMVRRDLQTTFLGKPILDIPPAVETNISVFLNQAERRFYNLFDGLVSNAITRIAQTEQDCKKIEGRVLPLILCLRSFTSHFCLCTHILPLLGTTDYIETLVQESLFEQRFPAPIKKVTKLLLKIARGAEKQVGQALKSMRLDTSPEAIRKALLGGLPRDPSKSKHQSGPGRATKGKKGRKKNARNTPNKLVKFSIGWFLEHGGELLHSAKTKAVLKQTTYWMKQEPESKIIVFGFFKETLRILEQIYDHYGVKTRVLSGGMAGSSQQKALDEWSSENDIPILLASLKAGSEGLNLIVASKVILIDSWWNCATENQSFGRVYRFGQTKPTELVKLIAHETIDDHLSDMKVRKTEGINSIMGAENSKVMPGFIEAMIQRGDIENGARTASNIVFSRANNLDEGEDSDSDSASGLSSALSFISDDDLDSRFNEDEDSEKDLDIDEENSDETSGSDSTSDGIISQMDMADDLGHESQCEPRLQISEKIDNDHDNIHHIEDEDTMEHILKKVQAKGDKEFQPDLKEQEIKAEYKLENHNLDWQSEVKKEEMNTTIMKKEIKQETADEIPKIDAPQVVDGPRTSQLRNLRFSSHSPHPYIESNPQTTASVERAEASKEHEATITDSRSSADQASHVSSTETPAPDMSAFF